MDHTPTNLLPPPEAVAMKTPAEFIPHKRFFDLHEWFRDNEEEHNADVLEDLSMVGSMLCSDGYRHEPDGLYELICVAGHLLEYTAEVMEEAEGGYLAAMAGWDEPLAGYPRCINAIARIAARISPMFKAARHENVALNVGDATRPSDFSTIDLLDAVEEIVRQRGVGDVTTAVDRAYVRRVVIGAFEIEHTTLRKAEVTLAIIRVSRRGELVMHAVTAPNTPEPDFLREFWAPGKEWQGPFMLTVQEARF